MASAPYVPPRRTAELLGRMVTDLYLVTPRERFWILRRIGSIFPAPFAAPKIKPPRRQELLAKTTNPLRLPSIPEEVCNRIAKFCLLPDWESFARAVGAGPTAVYGRKICTVPNDQTLQLYGDGFDDSLTVSSANVDELRSWQWGNLDIDLSDISVAGGRIFEVLSRFLSASRLGVQKLGVRCSGAAQTDPPPRGGCLGPHVIEERLLPTWRFPRARFAYLEVCGSDCPLLRKLDLPLVAELAVHVAQTEETQDVRPALLALIARCPELTDVHLRGPPSEEAVCIAYLATSEVQGLHSFTWDRDGSEGGSLAGIETSEAPGPAIFRRRISTKHKPLIEGFDCHAGSRVVGSHWRAVLLSLVVSDAPTLPNFACATHNWNVLPFRFGTLAYWAVETICFSLEPDPRNLLNEARQMHPQKDLLLAVRQGGNPAFLEDLGPRVSVIIVEVNENSRAQCRWRILAHNAPADLDRVVASLGTVLTRTCRSENQVVATLCVLDDSTMEHRRRFSPSHNTDLARLPELDLELRPRRWLCPRWTVGFNPQSARQDPQAFAKDVRYFSNT